MGFQILLPDFLYLTFTWQFKMSPKRSYQQTNRISNATLQTAGGVNIATENYLGHANSTTTGRIYIHAIQSADQAAADTLENLLNPLNKSKIG